jgi:hypothetical protein
MPSEGFASRALAAAACLGLLVLQAPPGRAAGYVLHATFCGATGRQVPIDRGRRPGLPDCPSPCHATCPRKQAGIGDDDPHTG